MKGTAIGALVLLLLAAGSLLAQVELTGRLEGSVKDETGAVVPGASVTATHVGTNFVYRATTSAIGRFVIPQ
ncbi:MAG: carboxypeptidase-like regulatory domain-containing protein, partial [Candidatus Binatia bacterium]